MVPLRSRPSYNRPRISGRGQLAPGGPRRITGQWRIVRFRWSRERRVSWAMGRRGPRRKERQDRQWRHQWLSSGLIRPLLAMRTLDARNNLDPILYIRWIHRTISIRAAPSNQPSTNTKQTPIIRSLVLGLGKPSTLMRPHRTPWEGPRNSQCYL